jgi:hypothetical protein
MEAIAILYKTPENHRSPIAKNDGGLALYNPRESACPLIDEIHIA